LNLILILLIAIFFVLHCFPDCFFIAISSIDIYLIKNFAYLCFLGLSLLGSPHSHDLDHRSKRIARVDFGFLLKYFSYKSFACIFFTFLLIEPSQLHILDCVFDLLTEVGYWVRSRFFLLFVFTSFHHIDRCPFLTFLVWFKLFEFVKPSWLD
jgi:hypothetical protein